MQPSEQNNQNKQPEHQSAVDSSKVYSAINEPSSVRSRFIGYTIALVIILVVGVVLLMNLNKSEVKVSPISNAVAPAQVEITRTGFLPSTVSIQPGQAVEWTNDDTVVHQVNSDPYPADNALPGLNSPQDLQPGQSFTYVFVNSGTYTYHDNLNPIALRGTVNVN